MRPIKRLIQLDEALRLAMERAREVRRVETVPIVCSSGRVCAETVVSKVNVPPFSRSAMDGYAVKASDTYGAAKLKPVRLKRIEVLYAGSVPRKSISSGRCVEIATGAMLPKGADSVVMVEDTELEGSEVLIYDSVHPGENVSKIGEDISAGTPAVSKGDVLNPSKIGALAAIGMSEVAVYSRPLVAVVPTGNEVAELGSDLKRGQVYDINSYTLACVIEANGGEARRLPVTSDSIKDLESVLGRNKDCDILVFSGGSSVGERDIMLDVLEKHGSVVFHGVAIKPGKPTLFGTIGRQLMFGMPGYPTACLSNAYILLAPVLRKMAMLPPKVASTAESRMAKRVVSTTGRTQFLTVRLEGGRAYPAFKESGAITSMAFADGYVIVPADVDLIEKDEKVVVHLL